MSGYKTWVDLDILTAADLNGYLMAQAVPRFATTAARDAAITAPVAGQMAYTTTGGPAFYNAGKWCPLPGTEIARLVQATGQTLTTSGTAYPVTWDTQWHLPFGGHSAGVNPSRFIFPFPGRYQVFAHLGFLTNATGYRSGYFLKNGASLQYGGYATVPAVTGTATTVTLTTTLPANGTTDYLEVTAIQGSGGSLAMQNAGGAVASNLVVVYNGP